MGKSALYVFRFSLHLSLTSIWLFMSIFFPLRKTFSTRQILSDSPQGRIALQKQFKSYNLSTHVAPDRWRAFLMGMILGKGLTEPLWVMCPSLSSSCGWRDSKSILERRQVHFGETASPFFIRKLRFGDGLDHGISIFLQRKEEGDTNGSGKRDMGQTGYQDRHPLLHPESFFYSHRALKTPWV